jgi:hypothetical protein
MLPKLPEKVSMAMRVVRWLVVAACAGASLALVGPASASHKYCAWHGDDVGCAEIGNHEVTSCDREADNHFVRAWYTDNAHFEDHAGAWDRNGSPTSRSGKAKGGRSAWRDSRVRSQENRPTGGCRAESHGAQHR